MINRSLFPTRLIYRISTCAMASCLGFLSLASYAQSSSNNVDILWGTPVEDSKRMDVSAIVGNNDSGIVVLRYENQPVAGSFLARDYAFEHFNSELTRDKVRELNFEREGKKGEYEFTIQAPGHLYFLSSARDKSEKRKILYVQELDPRTLDGKESPRPIMEMDISNEGSRNYGRFDFALSPDSSKLVLFAMPAEDKKSDVDIIDIRVFDSDLDLMWERQIRLPYRDELLSLWRYEVDNDGNVFVLGRLITKQRKIIKKGDPPNYEFRIFGLYPDTEEILDYAVDSQGKFLLHPKLRTNANGEVLCAWLYSSVGSRSSEGTFLLKMNGRTGEVEIKDFRKYDIDLLTQNNTEKRAKKIRKDAEKGKDVELFEYELDHFHLKENGEMILVGEQYYTTTTASSSDRSSTSTTIVYNYNDILVLSLDAEGKPKWAQRIPKNQRGYGAYYYSYIFAPVGDDLYFIYNDNPGNFNYPGHGKIETFVGGDRMAVLVKMNAEGNMYKEVLLPPEKSDVKIRPMVHRRISSNQWVVAAYEKRNNEREFAKLTFRN